MNEEVATPLQITEELAGIIDELKDYITEKMFDYRWDLIKIRHHIGKTIIENEAKLPTDYIKVLAPELKISERILYQSIQFAKKFPDIDKLPDGKAISWHKIANQLLPEHKEDKPSKEEKLDEEIKQFIVDIFPGERAVRKKFIMEVVKEWENYTP